MVILRLLVLGYILAIFGVIVGSWFPIAPDGPAARVYVGLRRITDPVLEPVRRVIPPIGGMIDLSPMLVLFVLFTVYSLLGA